MISERDLIIDSEIKERIQQELSCCTTDVNIITAYCKLSSLKFFDQFISPGIRKRLLVRFLPSDISSGATDKEIYNYCTDNNWDLYFDFNMHAKTYIFDKLKCVVGSANLTNNGLGLASNPNTELLSYFSLNEESYNKVLTLYKNSRKMTDSIFEQICQNEQSASNNHNPVPLTIDDNITVLMPEDFPTVETDLAELYSLKSYLWLKQYLSSKQDHSAYFGELSSAIHNIFVKDPRPYRKDIKAHLSELLDAIKRTGINEITVSRPNYSERITLNS